MMWNVGGGFDTIYGIPIKFDISELNKKKHSQARVLF